MNTKAKCYKCNKSGYFCTTPNGGNDVTCPLCTYHGELNYCLENDDDDYRIEYCEYCKIIFQLGDIHANNGCTSDVIHALLVTKYEINDVIYDSMPKFESFENMQDLIENKKIKLEWSNFSAPENDICERSYYPIER